MDKYEFNEEAAKAGKPIEYESANGEWVEAYFVGISHNGRPVIEVPGRGMMYVPKNVLRMKRVTKTTYVNLYKDGLWKNYFTADAAKEACLRHPNTFFAVAVPVEVDI